ncbi:TraB/GumN family protein [Gammaproteobacteria bacterium]|nr:TraB/GumN family protein [Gammaproteobacteria bacterium]
MLKKTGVIFGLICGFILINSKLQAQSYYQAAKTTVGMPFFIAEKQNKKIYVIGTMHAGRKDDFPFKDKIQMAMSITEKLLFEISLKDFFESPSLYEKYQCNNCLINSSSPKNYALFKKHFGRNKKSWDIIQRMPDWLAYRYLSSQSALKFDLSVFYGVELNLMRHVIQSPKKVPIDGLEVMAERERMPMRITGDLLTAKLENYFDAIGQDLNGQHFQELYNLWRKGDVEKLYHLQLAQQMSYADPYLDSLGERYIRGVLDERNHNMFRQIMSTIARHKTITVAVGAAHLGGEAGILSLLHKQGYQIHQH